MSEEECNVFVLLLDTQRLRRQSRPTFDTVVRLIIIIMRVFGVKFFIIIVI